MLCYSINATSFLNLDKKTWKMNLFGKWEQTVVALWRFNQSTWCLANFFVSKKTLSHWRIGTKYKICCATSRLWHLLRHVMKQLISNFFFFSIKLQSYSFNQGNRHKQCGYSIFAYYQIILFVWYRFTVFWDMNHKMESDFTFEKWCFFILRLTFAVLNIERTMIGLLHCQH